MKRKYLALAGALLAGATLASCGSGGDSSAVEQAIADAQNLSRDQLFQKAAEELGTTGVLKILATTSRGGKDAVKNAFVNELKKYNSAITTDCLKYDTVVDGVIYTQLLAEIQAGSTDGYSGAICQDGYQLQTKGLDTGLFKNYIPKEWSDAVDAATVTASSNPFTLQYNFKTWMYNKSGTYSNMVIDNVWDITDSSYKGRIDTMNPNNENVNMDWLIQLTADDQVQLLKEAYNDSTRDSDVNLETYSKYGEKKYAYAFIDKFLTNAVFYDDDGKAMTHLAQTPGNVGWIVYSKLLKVEESDAISKANIVVAALGTDNADAKQTNTASCIKGFAGFMYKHYLQVMPNAQYPYATCAFFNLISTTSEAYSVWAGDVGDYPTLPSINKDRTKNGYVDVEGVKTSKFACLNDPTSNWWINYGKAVIETPSFIGANYDSVITAIDASIAAKK